MQKIEIPNTTVIPGRLTEGDLEKILDASVTCGIEIKVNSNILITSINKRNVRCEKFKLVSEYNQNPNNSIIFSPMYYKKMNESRVYLNLKISEKEDIQKRFNEKLIEYGIYKEI